MGGRRRSKNLSKMAETSNKVKHVWIPKKAAEEVQSSTVSSSNPQASQKNKEVAEQVPHMNIGSYSQFNVSEDFGLDYDSDDFGLDYDSDGFGFDDYDFNNPFTYDDYMDPLRYDEEGNYRGDYSHWGGDQRHWAMYHGYPIPDYLLDDEEEEEEEEVEVDLEKISKMAVLQKEEDELIDKPMNIGEMSKFTTEIVFDILSRLPIKTLARCRCVSKDIRSITHIRRFIQMHHKRATQGDIHPSILLHVKSYTNAPLCLLQHDTLDDTLDAHVVFAKPLFSFPKKEFDIVGSCNGLLCLSDTMYDGYGPRYVYNPVTGEYIKIPKPDITNIDVDSNLVYGFGYDETVNDYKVVRMEFLMMDPDGLWDIEGEVYSLSLGKWRKIQTDGEWRQYRLRHFTAPAFVNGALHWMDVYGVLIVSFDLGREEFQEVPPPPGFSPDCSGEKMNVGVLGEHLCLFDYSINGQLEIWVMKEYGIQWSWSKEYVISSKDSVQDSGRFIPLRLMGNGELLLSYKGECLVSYDPVKKQLRDIQIKGLPLHSDAVIHATSLLPLRNVVGLANKDEFNFSFSKWCSESFPIPAHESIKLGDKQLAEHGNPDKHNEENLPFFKKPEGRNRLQGEGASDEAAKRMYDSYTALISLFGRGLDMDIFTGEPRRSSERDQGSQSGNGSGKGRKKGKGKRKGKGKGKT